MVDIDRFNNNKNTIMNEDTKELLTDCANFIQPYVEDGDEAERLLEKLDEALEQGQDLPLHTVSGCDLPDTPDDEIYDYALELHSFGRILGAAMLIKRHTTMTLDQAKMYCYSHYR